MVSDGEFVPLLPAKLTRRNYFFLAGFAALAPSLALVDLGAGFAAGFLSAISVAPFDCGAFKSDRKLLWHPHEQ